MSINSKYDHINNHTQLVYTIMQLNASRAQQEDEVKHKLKEIYYSFQPGELLKKIFSKENKPKIQKNIAQSALSVGTNFLINKVFKSSVSIKGYLLSLAMEKVADYAISGKSKFLKNGAGKIGGFFQKFKSNFSTQGE